MIAGLCSVTVSKIGCCANAGDIPATASSIASPAVLSFWIIFITRSPLALRLVDQGSEEVAAIRPGDAHVLVGPATVVVVAHALVPVTVPGHRCRTIVAVWPSAAVL